jgi:hypothetical protein
MLVALIPVAEVPVWATRASLWAAVDSLDLEPLARLRVSDDPEHTSRKFWGSSVPTSDVYFSPFASVDFFDDRRDVVP